MTMNTILVVDDEPNYLIVLSELLRDEGFEVYTAPEFLERRYDRRSRLA